VAVDRIPRLPVMLISDVLRGGLLGLIAAMAYLGRLEIAYVFVMNLLFSVVEAFFDPAYAAVVPEIVAEDDLPSANSINNLGVQAARIAGPPLGAALVVLGGPELALALDGVTFFISGAFILPLLRRREVGIQKSKQAVERSHFIQDLKKGIGFVVSSPWLLSSIGMFALANIMLVAPYGVALPFFVKDHLGAEADMLGIFHAFFATGYVLGGIWLGRKPRIRRRGLHVYFGLVAAGLFLFAFGLQVPIAVLLAAALFNGVALEISGLAWTNSLQELVPPDHLGRVSSIDLVGSMALLPIGYGLAGLATELYGSPFVFATGGLITAIVAALLLLRYPVIRGLD
jgi:predicted MFS family arabinose efflux permease